MKRAMTINYYRVMIIIGNFHPNKSGQVMTRKIYSEPI